MSQIIDTKVVEMKFDNSSFEKNVAVSLNSLKFLNKNIEEAGKNRNSLDALAKAGDQVGVSFDNMSQKSRITLNAMDMLAGVGTRAFNRISDALASFTMNMANSLSGMQAMRDGFAEYELKMGSVQTILAGAKIIDPKSGRELKNEAERLEVVNAKLEALNAYSDRTIYSFKDMTSNIGKFTNAGVNLSDAVDAIQGVANVAAISGANAGEASRAMYNFAQALSSGYVKLIDWKSIENANMATVGFKEQLLETALALGTVRKEGDMYISTTTDANGKVSAAFNATKMFNDSLSNQWMTTEVLTTTLKKYTDESTELGKKAFAAATEVKTFSQMMDTLKESLGSGWAKSFEIILGDFREAKNLWTSLNNVIESMLSPIGDARNAILQMWKDNGGRDAMIKSFSNLYQAIKNLFSPIKELWSALTPNTTTTGKALAIIFKAIERLTGVVAKAAEVIGKVLATVLKPVVYVANAIGSVINKLFGVIRNVFSRVVDVFRPVGKSINSFADNVSKAFDNKVIGAIKNFGSAFGKTLDNIKGQIANSSALQKIIESFKELKNIIKDLVLDGLIHLGSFMSRISKYFSNLWTIIKPFLSLISGSVLNVFSGHILPGVQNGLDFITRSLSSLGKTLKSIDLKNSGFYKGVTELPGKIKSAFGKIDFSKSGLYTGIKSFGTNAIDVLTEKFGSLKRMTESISMPKGLSSMLNGVKDFIANVFGAESVNASAGAMNLLGDGKDIKKSGQEMTNFQKFINGVTKAFELLAGAVYLALTSIKDFVVYVAKNTPKAFKAFKNFLAGDDGVITMKDFSDVIYDLSDAMSMLLRSIGILKTGNALGNITGSLSGSLQDLTVATTDLFKKLSNKMNMSAIKDFAIAIGILAGALAVLSMIEPNKLFAAAAALSAVTLVFKKFFEVLSKTDMNIARTAGAIPIGALILSIGVSMMAVAASIGVLVGALAIFPKVIKAYNNLGDDFRTGMDRVKEVLEEIFEYIGSLSAANYGFKGAAALVALVYSLDKIRKTIVKYASKETGEAMSDGLERIKEVMDLLAGFLSSASLASFNGVNIGINFNTLGIAAMIWALGNMIEDITDPITKLSQLTPEKYETAFNGLTRIMISLFGFVGGLALIQKGTGSSFGQWIGMAAMVTLLASAIGSIVGSLDTIAKLVEKDGTSFSAALFTLEGIFASIAGLMFVIGKMDNNTAPIFGMMLLISAITACVVALTPLAATEPWALVESVAAVGVLMLALGESLKLATEATGKTSIKDLLMLVVMGGLMLVIANTVRRLAKTVDDPGGIVAAGAAVSGALLAIGGAMKLMNGVHLSLTLLAGLALLTIAIWGIVAAIKAFKGSAADMSEASTNAGNGMKEVATSVKGVFGEEMQHGLFDALKNINWSELFGGIDFKGMFGNIDIGEGLRNAIERVKQDAKNWGQDFIDIGTNIVEGIGKAIGDPANIEKIKSAIKTLGEGLLNGFKAFFGISSPSTVMAEQGGFIIDGLVQGLMNFPDKIGQWVESLGTSIKEGVGGFIESAREKGGEWIDKLGEGIQNGKEFVKRKAGDIATAAAAKTNKASEWARNATRSANAFGQKLSASSNPIKSSAGRMIVGATNVINTTRGIFQKSANAAANAYSSSIRSGRGGALSAGAALVAGAKSAFNGIRSAFSTYGMNAAQGFRSGIRSMVSSIASAAASLVRRAKEAAKNEQHSSSPSKDFMEYGGWAAQGYAIGLTNRNDARLIEANARKMVGVAKSTIASANLGLDSISLGSNPLAAAIKSISDSIDDNIDANPTIRPVVDMSNIRRSAADISTLFDGRSISAGVNAAMSVRDNFEASRANDPTAASLRSLTKQLGAVTESMNSRSLNNYVTVEGASDPEAFADGLLRGFRLNARTV